MDNILKNIAPEYDITKSYEVGDYCIYSNAPYICIEDTNGNFDADKWQRVYLSEMISGKLSGSIGGNLIFLEVNYFAKYGSSVTFTFPTTAKGGVVFCAQCADQNSNKSSCSASATENCAITLDAINDTKQGQFNAYSVTPTTQGSTFTVTATAGGSAGSGSTSGYYGLACAYYFE